MPASILDYNNALNSYNKGNYQQAQQQAAPFGSSVSNLFSQPLAPSNSSPSSATSAPGNSQQPQLQGASQQDINAIYDPLMSDISQKEGNQQSQLDTALGNINNQGQTLTGDLNSQTAQQDQLTENQKSQLQTSQQSAYDQATQAAAWAQQNALGLYGHTASPIANTPFDAQSYMNNQSLNQATGNIGSSYQTALGNLLTQQQQVHTYAMQKQADIKGWVADQQAAARQTMQDNLSQLESARFAAQGDKAKMQYQAIQDLHNSYNQIQLQAYQTQLALNQWTQEQATSINSGLSSIRQNAVNYATNNPFSASQDQFNQGTQVSQAPQNNTAGTPQMAYGQSTSSSNDPYAQLTTPGY